MTETIPAAYKHLEIINDGTDEAAWLQARKGFRTATQAAAIAGSHPYLKLIDVWNSCTDPNYDPDAERNRYLEERAKNGQEREASIIEWATEDPRTGGPGNPFVASKALVKRKDLDAPHAATPDGCKFAKPGVLVLIEAKTTQQDWETDGLPQHIYDQCLWQLYTTGAVTVWVAVERTAWSGRGKNRKATVVSRWLVAVQQDENRLAFLLARVAQFEEWLANGIAPESDIDLRALEVPDWDADEEQVAEWEQLAKADEMLTELAEIRDRMAADAKRDEELVELLKPIVKQYDGRRIWLIGQRFTAKLVRGTRTVTDTKKLAADDLRRITSWAESETVKFEPNPEYVAPTETENIA